jgi:hypothetical protein
VEEALSAPCPPLPSPLKRLHLDADAGSELQLHVLLCPCGWSQFPILSCATVLPKGSLCLLSDAHDTIPRNLLLYATTYITQR